MWADRRALAAWDSWRAISSLEDVTAAEVPVLAAAYRRLRRLGAEDPMLSIARGIYRRTWYLNQLGLRRAATVVAELRAAGIEVLVMKGAALALLYHRDLGARPMQDLDLLVGPDRLAGAVETLAASGWQALSTQGMVNGPLRYATHVEDENENEVDLHAYALLQSVDDSDLWETRVPLLLIDTPTHALAPAEQLIHVCTHGMRWDGLMIRWAIDAMTILRAAGDQLDWARLVERSRARRLTVAVGAALGWLRQSLDADIPGSVLDDLNAGPRLRFERTVHKMQARPPTSLRLAIMSLDRYRRFAKLAPAGERPRSLAEYLRTAWELDRGTDVLRHGSRKLAVRARAYQ